MNKRSVFRLNPIAVLVALVGGLLELATLQSWRLHDRMHSRR